MSHALRKAIKLREWTRRALDADDAAGDIGLSSTRPLVRAAADAERALSPSEWGSYMDYARKAGWL